MPAPNPFFVLAFSSLGLLAACNRPAPAAVPAPVASAASVVAASLPASVPGVPADDAQPRIALQVAAEPGTGGGAADDGKPALLHEIFRDWTPGTPLLTEVPGQPDGDGKSEPETVALEPAFVAAPDDTHRMLVVIGSPSSDDGELNDAHANGGDLGVYGFVRREGRWFLAGAWPSVNWSGSHGSAGEVGEVVLGPGRSGAAVEGGGCWQGHCGTWLSLFELAPAGPRALFAEAMPMNSSSSGTTGSCGEWLAAAKAASAADEAPASTCFEVEGHWRIEPAKADAPARLVADFTGEDVPEGQGGASKPVLRRIRQSEVFELRGARFERVQGENPNHAL